MGAHGRAFDLEEMSVVEGEIVMDKDKSCELKEELCGWLGVGRALSQGLSVLEHPCGDLPLGRFL